MAAKSEYPSEFATRLIRDTCIEFRKYNNCDNLKMTCISLLNSYLDLSVVVLYKYLLSEQLMDKQKRP